LTCQSLRDARAVEKERSEAAKKGLKARTESKRLPKSSEIGSVLVDSRKRQDYRLDMDKSGAKAEAPRLDRQPSSTSSAGSKSTLSPRAGMNRTASSQVLERAAAKRRARTNLRDYYGLSDNSKSKQAAQDESELSDPKQLFDHLYNTASLADMIEKDKETVEEIKELESERQALVYNHHHELIAASDTIHKMQTRSESLDTSLDALRSSFESISQLTTSLSQSSVSLSQAPKHTETAFDPLVHLAPLIDLPAQLRILLKNDKRNEAHSLWGSREPILRAWEEAGVKGVGEIARECRAVLGRARRPSAATITTTS